ncbi:radical SAM family heme chaperone HemW [Tamlana fucoidanivorans]|uniref:Heme chaperone HemW n=1 Tax=Allotamlana fucoidanivorans TaxID=2583814 RepID=A0A5C4SN73_9FLAO|nr:radical SAM family heme chaperone HemW [Tamlana fucoidanivorans]TNJ45248.1 radical SAM family heme chaperone HemW [Tamlana fucoidanivorans]
MAGIYIHIPFCKQACFYCDFHFSTSLKKKEDMIACLVKEIVIRKDALQGQPIETIYFGGGTPSLLTNEELASILNVVHQNFTVVANPEITLEANPDDLSSERIKNLSESKINRLSIGIQSFFDDDLKSMNRAHNAEEAVNCLKTASKYFDNITIDLIYGIPKMGAHKWNKNLDIALSFNINHISSYALTVEPKTALDAFIKKGVYPPVEEALALQHFNHLINRLETEGFVQYEISNFGRQNYFSKHNTSYWQGKPYLGIGPSAHSFVGNQRSWNVANNSKYILGIQKGTLPETVEVLSKKDRYNEFVMTGLRTIWGVSFTAIEEVFGEAFILHLKKASEKFVLEGLLQIETQHREKVLKATSKGKFLIDGIASELFMI